MLIKLSGIVYISRLWVISIGNESGDVGRERVTIKYKGFIIESIKFNYPYNDLDIQIEEGAVFGFNPGNKDNKEYFRIIPSKGKDKEIVSEEDIPEPLNYVIGSNRGYLIQLWGADTTLHKILGDNWWQQ